MKYFVSIFLSLILSNSVLAASLTEEAVSRGVNPNCITHLNNIEKSFGLNGLNVTFAKPEETKTHPSLHTSTKHFNNGATIFSSTLFPNGESCDVSIVLSTIINNQSCDDITQSRIAADATLKVTKYAEGTYTHIYPESNAYQLVLVATGEQSCVMTESRMMWLGN